MPKTKPHGTYPTINAEIRRTYPHYVKSHDGSIYQEKGESQDEMIYHLGLRMDPSTLSAYENGRADCPASLLVMMADRFGCSVDALLSRDMSGFRYNSYNPRIELLKLSPVEDNLRFTLTGDTSETYTLDEKFAKSLTVKAFRIPADLPVLNAKAGDIVLIDTDVKKYVNKDMDKRFMCMLTNQARDIFNLRYWFGYVNQVFDDAGIARGKCFYFNLPKGQMKLCRYETLTDYVYGVVVQVVRYYI